MSLADSTSDLLAATEKDIRNLIDVNVNGCDEIEYYCVEKGYVGMYAFSFKREGALLDIGFGLVAVKSDSAIAGKLSPSGRMTRKKVNVDANFNSVLNYVITQLMRKFEQQRDFYRKRRDVLPEFF